MSYKYYTFRHWVQQDKLNWNVLSCNELAIKYLEENPDKISWYELSSNSNAEFLLEKNLEKLHWEFVYINRAFINIYKKHQY